MLYHVMVYSDEPDDHYAHPYAVHLFVGEKPTYEWAFSEAERLLDEYFPAWRGDHHAWPELAPPLRFVGVEGLQVDPCEAVILAKFERGGEWGDLLLAKVAVVKPLPEETMDAILQLRLSQLTLDLDWESPSKLHETLEALRCLPVGEPRVYRTYGGYHIRAPLHAPASDIWEILEMRRRADDDPARLRIDELYSTMGFPDLANLLFNEKAWWEEGKLLSYREEFIDPETVVAEYSRHLGYTPPQLNLQVGRVLVWTEGDSIKCRGPLSWRSLAKLVDELEEKEPLREAKELAELRRRLVDLYSDLHPRLGEAVGRCEVVKGGDGVVLVRVPRELSGVVGRLIGRGGCNIRTAEARLGQPIRIIQEEVPEEVEMRRRLRRLLGEVA